MTAKYSREVHKLLGPRGATHEFIARYTGAVNHEDRKPDEQSKLTYWGITIPKLRTVAKQSFSFSHLSDEKQWEVWLSIWRTSKIFDVKTVAQIWMFGAKLRELRLKKHKDLIAMASEIDNWAHSDSLSSVLAEILEEKPKLFEIYKKWNKSSNPWLRRQSLVGIYCYARFRKKPVSATKSLQLVEQLLEDPHFYVQRGVGWTLREIDRVDFNKQRKFVRKNLGKISGVAWYAASELYPVKLRKELVEMRKSLRNKGVLPNGITPMRDTDVAPNTEERSS